MASRFSVDRGGSTTFGAGYQSLTGGKNQKSTGEMLSERGGHNDDQTSSAEKVLQANFFFNKLRFWIRNLVASSDVSIHSSRSRSASYDEYLL